MTYPIDFRRRRRRPSTSSAQSRLTDAIYYQPPRLARLGSLRRIIQGNSWKGIDSYGELDPQQME